MIHLWWTATCKTEDCGELLWLKFIGSFHEGNEGDFADPILQGHCPKCGSIDTYRESDVRLREGVFPGKSQPSDAPYIQ